MPSPEGFLPKIAAAITAGIWQRFAIAACVVLLLFGGLWFWELQRVAAVRGTLPRAAILWTVISGGAATILLLFAYTWRATRKLVQPIRHLAQGLQAVASRAPVQSLRISMPDEIGAIATAFSAMTDRLAGARHAEAQALLELRGSNEKKDALHARLERIIAGMRDGLFEGVGTAAEATLWVSARFWEILGHRARDMPETVAESALIGLVHPDDLPRFFAVIGDNSISVELRMRTAQGEWLWVHLRSTANVESDGKKVGFWGSLQDISERKRNEDRLAHQEALLLQDVTDMRNTAEALREARDAAESASRAKSEFLATMSHEIRTPLNGVIGMTGLLLETALNSEQREFAQIARSSGESLLALINDILDFSKIESGSLELESIDFDLRSVIDESVDAIALQASEKHLEVLVDVALTCPQSVRGDPTRLRQILLNLLSNAVKFTAAGDISLTVSSAAAPAGRLALDVAVADSGIGIPQDRIGRLFTPFTQADASTTRRHGGTGLGLSICRRLITAMGGTISIDSRPGFGTTFRFQILLDPSAHAAALRQAPVPSQTRALLVEDHPVNRRILGALLQSWGVAVATANDAEAALIQWDALAAAGETPQLAILDHHLPGHDGDWLGRQIRQRDRAGVCKLVLLRSLDSHSRNTDRGPFDRLIVKPVKPDALYSVLAELTGGQPTPLPAGAIESARFDGLRALLVDDNPVNQKIGHQLLMRMGFHVTPAWNGRQALELLRAERFDVVLMDCQMPEMDGYDATRALRRADSGVLDCGVPVIAMTANALAGDRERCLAAGMDDYLTKPIHRTSLAAALGNVIEQRWASSGGLCGVAS